MQTRWLPDRETTVLHVSRYCPCRLSPTLSLSLALDIQPVTLHHESFLLWSNQGVNTELFNEPKQVIVTIQNCSFEGGCIPINNLRQFSNDHFHLGTAYLKCFAYTWRGNKNSAIKFVNNTAGLAGRHFMEDGLVSVYQIIMQKAHFSYLNSK